MPIECVSGGPRISKQRDSSDFLMLRLNPDGEHLDIRLTIPNENSDTIRVAKKVTKLVCVHSTLGRLLGSGIGKMCAYWLTLNFQQRVHVILPTVHASSDKVERIFRELIGQQTSIQEQMDIICPVSGYIFCCPIITPCGHTFDYQHIVQLLRRDRQCPVAGCGCELEIEDLTLDFVKMDKVVKFARKIFGSLEQLLHWFSKWRNRMGLCNRSLVHRIAAVVQNGNSLLEDNTIFEKIRNNELSEEDGYAISYFTIQQFAPFRKWIIDTCVRVDGVLSELVHLDGLSPDTRHHYQNQLIQWRRRLDILSREEFPLLHEISKIASKVSVNGALDYCYNNLRLVFEEDKKLRLRALKAPSDVGRKLHFKSKIIKSIFEMTSFACSKVKYFLIFIFKFCCKWDRH